MQRFSVVPPFAPFIHPETSVTSVAVQAKAQWNINNECSYH